MNQQKIKILAVLSDLEWADFLPGESGEWLSSLPGFRRVDSASVDPGEWEAFLASERPDVLVSAWSTPPLPASLADTGEMYPRYVCHLTGTVKRMVPRVLLEKGLLVTNWGDSISRTVAEAALMLILSCLRRTVYWTHAMHNEGAWKSKDSKVYSLFRRSVGLHGFGAISRQLVPLLRPFEVEISTYSPRVPDDVLESLGVRRANSLDELFSSSQVLVELAPKTPANHHIVDEKLLRLLPEDGVFVNVGRGAVVDEAALARLAAEGRLHVGLDVFEKEPLPADSPLRGLRNVMLCPHQGGPTQDRRRDAGTFAMENLKAYLEDGSLKSVITPEVYDRST